MKRYILKLNHIYAAEGSKGYSTLYYLHGSKAVHDS